MSVNKTVRLILPQWQGGVNPDYYLGSKILSAIVPESNSIRTIEVPVSQDFDSDLKIEQDINGRKVLLKQTELTKNILDIQNPDKVITLGGDCSISEAPIDYLSGKYGKKLGIIWLDAHPDVSTNQDSNHLHEMVLANLMNKSSNEFDRHIKNHIDSSQIMLAGLQYQDLRPMDHLVKDLNMNFITPDQIKISSKKVIDWINQNDFEKLVIHFDLDVLDSNDFRSVLSAEPYIDKESLDYATGTMKLNEVFEFIENISKDSEIVGFNIAEHMPWDAINLHNMLSKIDIFK
ncbi:arginase family protein [Companilactobacillus baiquanensis]|uniref:Arginase family protein n=1 Tax=Companilactobacillus baiquanensis TaxID=2486005 RepID=A0ABW1UVJ7_9LACO|nr:arginase family protein [Companilactobacillus baiquanensis]